MPSNLLVHIITHLSAPPEAKRLPIVEKKWEKTFILKTRCK